MNRKTTLQRLPEDILYHIVQFLNPLCTRDRMNLLCETIVPELPFLAQHFKKTKKDCLFEDHIYIQDRSLCMNSMSKLAETEDLHRKYFHSIVKQMLNDENLVKHNSKKITRYYEECYTFHFPDQMNFVPDHPLINFISNEILPCYKLQFSHLCCSGHGIYSTSLKIDR